MKVTYVENSKEYRSVIYKSKRKFEERGRCSWCGKSLPNKRWMWCRDEKNPEKYGECIGKYLATKGTYHIEARRINKEKYGGNLTCERCKIAIKDMESKQGNNKYDYDHIIPIALGGDPIAVENIQILCVKCHKAKTKEDVALIAEQRQYLKAEKARIKKEERLNRIYGRKSKWASLQDFQGVRNAH